MTQVTIYTVDRPVSDITAIHDSWLIENCGLKGGGWTAQVSLKDNELVIYYDILDPKKAVMFKLMFGGM